MPAPGDPSERFGRLSAFRVEGGRARLFVQCEQGDLELDASAEACASLRPGDWIAFVPEPATRSAQGPLLVRIRHVSSLPAGSSRSNDSSESDAARWHCPAPGRHGQPVGRRMELLRFRHRLVRALREHFDAQGFLEAETPALVRAPSPEAVFEPIPAGGGFLATSPEFQLKRMLVGGFQRVYRLGPVFRGGEVGAHHNPEFTLLEWYRAFEDSHALIADLQALLTRLAPLALEWAGRDGLAREEARPLIQLAGDLAASPYPVHTVAECFREHLGMEIGGVTTAGALLSAAGRAGIADAGSLGEAYPGDFTGLFSALWIRVEAGFGPGPRFVTEWPAPTASLARLKPGDPTVAERVELYAGGLELANGFAELTDPAEQRARFETDLAQRAAQGMPAVPLDEAFLRALGEGMPPAAGMALGVERLAMLLSGASHIRDVLPFAWDER